MDNTLSDATTPGQNGPGSNGNEGILRIPQCSAITGTSVSDYLVSYPGHSLVGVLPLCRDAVGVFCSPSRLGKKGRSVWFGLVCWVLWHIVGYLTPNPFLCK